MTSPTLNTPENRPELSHILERLKSTDPGVQSSAIKALVKLVEAGHQPWEVLLNVVDHRYWRVRLDAIEAIVKRDPPHALSLLHAFRNTSYHVSQQRVREYIEPRFDEGLFTSDQVALAKEILQGFIFAAKVTELSKRKAQRLLEKLNGNVPTLAHGNTLNAEAIKADNVVVGTQINQFVPQTKKQVFDPVWFTPKPYTFFSPRDYATGVLVVNPTHAVYTTVGLTVNMAKVLQVELVKFGGDIAAAWVKVDYLDESEQTSTAYFAEGGKGGLTTLLGGSGAILVALQTCISAKSE